MIVGAIVGALVVIGAMRVVVVGTRIVRRVLARIGRMLARLDLDAWCADVATDATVVDVAPRARRKVRT